MEQNNCDVIITYCWNRVGYNILRSLSKYGLKVCVADTSRRNICSMSKYCTSSFIYPDPFTEEISFIECLLDMVEKMHPKMLLPTHDESIIIMRHREKFPEDLIIPYDSEDKLLMLSNKSMATEIADKANVPIPKVYKSINDINKYPIVYKKVVGNSAKGVFFPKDKNELLKLIDRYGNNDVLLEEWVGGCDYSVDCIRWDSFFKSSVYRALVTKTDGGGTTTQREIVNMPCLEQYAKSLLDYVDFKGVCGLDFRYDIKTGDCAFIEVNARFTGGLATPIAAGFDIPWIVYKLATVGRYDNDVNLKLGTRTKWILGDLITIIDRLLSFKFVSEELKRTLQFSGFDAFDDYFVDDKKAFWGEMIYYFDKLLKNKKLNP